MERHAAELVRGCKRKGGNTRRIRKRWRLEEDREREKGRETDSEREMWLAASVPLAHGYHLIKK